MAEALPTEGTVDASKMSIEQLESLAFREGEKLELIQYNLRAIKAEIMGRRNAARTPAAPPNRESRRAETPAKKAKR